LQAIVALYGLEGEPVGSSVLANYFDMAVSSATLRNEMAALTKLGLLEQPHTSAGRVPSAKGYRYYLDNLLTDDQPLDRVTRARVEAVFASLDHEPEKLAQGAAKALAAISGCTAAVSTPCAEDLCVAHYEVVQVGRSAAAVLAVTTAGYVRTRVARVRTGLSRENAAALAALLNRNLTFVAPVDLSNRLLAELCSQIDPELVPVISAAAAILQDSAQPHVFLGGEQYLLNWPQLEGKVGDILTLLNDEEQAAHIIAPPADRSESVLLGEDLEPQIPGLCIVSDRYLVGGGLWGSIALIGPTRMPSPSWSANSCSRGISFWKGIRVGPIRAMEPHRPPPTRYRSLTMHKPGIWGSRSSPSSTLSLRSAGGAMISAACSSSFSSVRMSPTLPSS
jgi:heat-inducible transcriptional repressor